MKQVISASRRTDLPAFYIRWLLEKVKDNQVAVPNPFNRQQVKFVSLSPSDVAWFVFWSRNYRIFLQNYQAFQHYQCFFHFTINPFHTLLEPDMISPAEALRQMEKLVSIFGPETIIWRYDPLVHYQYNGKVESNHSRHVYKEFARTISNFGLKRCYISLVQLYPKVLGRAKVIKNFSFIEPDNKNRKEILQEMVDTASLYGLQIYSCSNDHLLDVTGIHKGHCIDGSLLNELGPDTVSEKELPTRPDCGCTQSVDIGDYVTTPCKYNCLYCYARK
jgi:hypothetical protein